MLISPQNDAAPALRVRRWSAWIAIVSAVVALGACGGGGGGGGTGGGNATPITSADAARLLDQATFGATDADMAKVNALGAEGWLAAQFAMPSTGYGGFAYVDPSSAIGCPAGSPTTCFRDNYSPFQVQTRFYRNAVTAPDQLRQRVAFALSQILVISGLEVVQTYAMATYQQVLLDDAFANYRKLIEDVTLSPAMGRFLDMVNNDKPDPVKGIQPNENYAREVLQLFSIGLLQLNDDGTPKRDGTGNTIPTYDQNAVEGFAHAFTGWTFPTRPGATPKWPNPGNYQGAMLANPAHHDTAPKTLLDGVTLPGGQDPATDLAQALDNIYHHPNVGPFIGRQLIQHLVTSNPSPAYVARVTAAFNDNGQGVRGDLQAVVHAILMDPEARGDAKTDDAYGRLREPAVMIAGLLRGAAGATATDGVYPRAASLTLAQNVFDAPSVFNFYPPDYPLRGTGLQAPPMAILNSTTALGRAQVVNRLVSAPVAPDASVAGATGTVLDTGPFQMLAGDPAALVDEIARRFFHGAMTAATRAPIVQAVQAIPAASPDVRAKAALYLALSSAQYQVQK